MIVQRILALALLSCVLVACGGGGGGGSTGGNDNPPPTTPPGGGSPNNPSPVPDPADWEQHSAENAKVTMLFTGTVLYIDWVDLFDDELGYQVERRVGAGDWEVVEALPAIDGIEGHWGRSVPIAASYRVTAVLPERSLVLHSPGHETEIAIDPAPSNPVSIELDQTEPVRGAVQVSLRNAGAAASVTYTLNGSPIARITGGGTFAATLPTQRLVSGQRELYAFIERSPGLTLSFSRNLQVDNPAPAVLLTFNTMIPFDGRLGLSARASSEAGITSVQFFVNGTLERTTYAPVPTTDQYAHGVNVWDLPPGPNVFRVVATDSTTATVAMEQTYVVDAIPALSVTGLFNGMITTGNRLRVTGEFSDDLGGANVSIYAGDLRLLRTQNSPFSLDVALDGVPPGERTVNIRVQDSQGKASSSQYRVIVPSTSLNYELLTTDATELLAADRGSLLYRNSMRDVILRNPAGAETQFPLNSFAIASYRMSEGRIVAFGANARVYLLDDLGQPTDISQTPSGPAFMQLPIVRGPWISWRQAAAPSTLRLYDLRTGLSRDVPTGDSMSGINHEIVTTPGNELVLFAGTIDSILGIYSLNLQTDATQLLVSGNVVGPRSDGTRVIWHDLTSTPRQSFIAPLSNPAAATILGTDVLASTLEGGLASWTNNASRLFVNDGSVTTELSAYFTRPMDEYTVEDGRIIYPENGVMRVWSAAGGEQTWLDALPTAAIQADGVAYFMTGSGGPLYSGPLYRVSLP